MTKREEASRRRHPTSMVPARRYLRSIGKCASMHADGYLCTIHANHQGSNHQAQIIGGIDDGKVLSEWPW